MKFEKLIKVRPTDTTDPGFRIPGFKLRWIAGRIAENNPGRPWVVIRKQDLTKEFLEIVEKTVPGAFSAGETIRRGDLVLAACPDELNEELKQRNIQAAKELESRVSSPDVGRYTKASVNRSKISVNDEMVEQFKKPQK